MTREEALENTPTVDTTTKRTEKRTETHECDYISRQAAVSRISDLLMLELKGQRLPTWDEVNEAINELPSAQPDVSDRKVGKWIVVERHEHYPSGKPYEQVQCPFCKRFDNNGDGRFCGYCGARMER